MATTNNSGFDFDATKSFDDIIVEVERDYNSASPHVGKIQSLALRNGPQVFRFATFQQILKQSTQEHHHNVLTIHTYKKLKDGWKRQDEKSIVLDDEKIDEIGILEEFIRNFYQYNNPERRIYKLISGSEYDKFAQISKSEIGDTIRNILKKPDAYNAILKEGGLNLMKDIVQWVFQQQNRESIIEKLNSLNTETLQELTTVAGISQINKVLDIWNQNKNNNSEEFWQRTFAKYSWIISQIFAAPTILYREKSYVGGKHLDNSGGNIIDMVYQNKLSANVILVELKTPCTEILGKEYRHTYSMSNETSGAISQTLNYKHNIQQHYLNLQAVDRTSVFEAINPRTLLVIGNYDKELKGSQAKIEAFELYRQNLKDITILTYDELFSKVELLKSILQNGK